MTSIDLKFKPGVEDFPASRFPARRNGGIHGYDNNNRAKKKEKKEKRDGERRVSE